MTRVKICGLSTPETMDAALDAGADFVGIVFFAKSPRNVDIDTAVALARRARGRAKIVALVVNPDDALLEEICETVAPDIIQLHGRETPERAQAVREMFGRPVMKAVSVASKDDVSSSLHDYADASAPCADIVLFDAKPPENAELPGGNGLTFDWRILQGIDPGREFALAGGLTPQNVGEAIRLTRAPIVDVSSGVETAPGVKSPKLIQDFIAAVKKAKPD